MNAGMPSPVHVMFSAGSSGLWKIERIGAVIGESLPTGDRLAVDEGPPTPPDPAAQWSLRGSTGNARYTNRTELTALGEKQSGLSRPQATRAALIPIRKTEKWWTLAQDERRAIMEERSHHIGIGLDYLPAVARRLHHSRELGEPFDFLTWFEFAPEHTAGFDEMLVRLRATEEWRYVEREVEIRLMR